MFRQTARPVVLALAFAPAVAAAQPVEKQKSEGGAGSIVGSLAFMMGFGDEFEVEGEVGGVDVSGDTDADSTLGIIPSVEKKFGNVVGIGAEYVFAWAKGEDADERRLLMSPHLRVRMSFPVYDRTTFDGMLGIGPTIWTSNEDTPGPAGDTRFGWSLRFAFGGSYAFNDAVSAFLDIGYYRSTTYGDDLTTTLTSVPVTLGLRSSF
jgi:hypothetical protein